MAASRRCECPLAKEITKLVECAICKEVITSPVTLKCFHFFCKTCVTRLYPSSPNLANVRCPLCRLTSSKTLPNNFFPSNVIQLLNDTKEQPLTATTCDVCRVVRSHEVNGDFLWVDCSTRLCEACAEFHKNCSFGADHKVVRNQKKQLFRA